MCAVIKNGDNPLTASVGKKTALNIANFTDQAAKIVMRAHEEAEEILAAARLEADALRDEAAAALDAARTEGERLHAAAREEGYAEGVEAGRLDGLADGAEKAFDEAMTRFDAQCGQLKELLRDAVMQLDAARDDILRQASGEMLDFAMEIARRITGLQAEGDVEAARKILARVIASAPCARRMKLRVNAGQYDQLKVYAEDYLTAMGMDTAVDVVADAELACGDVVLQTPEGGVDGRVAIQFDNIARAMTGRDYIPMEFEDISDLAEEQNAAAGSAAEAHNHDAGDLDEPAAEADDASAADAFVEDDAAVETDTDAGEADPAAIETGAAEAAALGRAMDQAGQLVDQLNRELEATGSLEGEGRELDAAGVEPAAAPEIESDELDPAREADA